MDRAAPGRTAREATRPDRDFVAIFDANAARLVRFAVFLGAEDPEDVVQEAFSRLFERRASFTGDLSQAGGYLRRTALNIVRDRARRSVRTRKVLRLHQREAEQVIPSVESTSMATEEGERLMAALSCLPPRRREAVVLRFWMDLPYAEIAAAMGTSLGSAKSSVSRGIDELHRHLESS